MKESRLKSHLPTGFRLATASDEELATLICDHASAVNCALISSVVRSVRRGRRTPHEAVACLVRLCPGGRVNAGQALKLLEAIRNASGPGANR